MGIPLYETAADIADLLAGIDPDLPADELPTVIRDTLDSLSLELRDKLERCAMVSRDYVSSMDVLKAEEARLAKRCKALERRRDGLHEYMMQAMQQAGISKSKTAMFTVSVQDNPTSVIIDDEQVLPTDYLLPQPPKVDKAAIKTALSGGQEVPGARLESSGKSLRVR